MKKLIIATLSILIVCTAINFAVITANSYDNESESEETTGNRTYIIKEYNGMVACFEEESDEPFLITETKVIDLPPIDRKMLADGVEVVGAKAFSRVLEDYRS